MPNEQQYIGYIQVEELLRKYLPLKSLLYSLQSELRTMAGLSPEDILLSKFAGNHILTDMPFGSGSDAMLKIIEAIQYKDRIIDQEAVQGLVEDILKIGEVVEKVTISLQGTPSLTKDIILEYYCENKQWKDICNPKALSRGQAKNLRREGIEQISKILRVTNEQWEYCMEQVR